MKISDQPFNNDDSFNRGDPHRIAYLMAGYLRNTLTEHEHDELDEWVGANDDNMRLFEELTDEQHVEAMVEKIKTLYPDEAYQDIKSRLGLPANSSPVFKRTGMRIAACLLLLTGLVFIYKTFIQPTKTSIPLIPVTNDIQPGGNHATLTLSNGSTINLDTMVTGVIIPDKEIGIQKLTDGTLAYNAAETTAAQPTGYHILSTPNGGEHKLILHDGTAVWLNAASSIKYPVAFNANSRMVELEGEAYFEVATSYLHDGKTKRSFSVHCNGVRIEVLGTHFNVSGYKNDSTASITLTDGKIAVSPVDDKQGAIFLNAGEELIYRSGIFTVNKNVDTTAVIAWKNGQFIFRDADIKTIMRQVERWYNIKVVYDDEITGHFNATIPRNVTVVKLLHYLELTKHVYFTITNDTIIVKRKET